MPRRPARPYPLVPVTEAAKIADTIRETNAGRPMNRLLLADAMVLSPTANTFRDLVTASSKYDFTKGNYNSEIIELKELGEQLTKPRSQEERLEALRQGMRKILLFDQILTHFDNNKLPDPEFLRNTLEREPFSVLPEWSQEAAQVFIMNGREVGFIRMITGSPYVMLDAGPPTEDVAFASTMVHDVTQEASDITLISHVDNIADGSPPLESLPYAPDVEPTPILQPSSSTPVRSEPTPRENRQFFIAHGWDKEALQQVQNILNRFRIPYVVAQEEPNAGRPISQKVHDLMKSCSAGIFIFSADEEFKDKDGDVIWRPRENVVFELGAGSLEYGQRIVIFKEESVYFPSDFRDVGYIEYEKGNLQGKAMDLLMELAALGAIQITA